MADRFNTADLIQMMHIPALIFHYTLNSPPIVAVLKKRLRSDSIGLLYIF